MKGYTTKRLIIFAVYIAVLVVGLLNSGSKGYQFVPIILYTGLAISLINLFKFENKQANTIITCINIALFIVNCILTIAALKLITGIFK